MFQKSLQGQKATRWTQEVPQDRKVLKWGLELEIDEVALISSGRTFQSLGERSSQSKATEYILQFVNKSFIYWAHCTKQIKFHAIWKGNYLETKANFNVVTQRSTCSKGAKARSADVWFSKLEINGGVPKSSGKVFQNF